MSWHYPISITHAPSGHPEGILGRLRLMQESGLTLCPFLEGAFCPLSREATRGEGDLRILWLRGLGIRRRCGSGSMGTADRMSTGAAVGESGEMTASERDGNIFTFPAPGQAPCEPDGRSNFAANPALGSSMPPGFNCPGGGGGGGD